MRTSAVALHNKASISDVLHFLGDSDVQKLLKVMNCQRLEKQEVLFHEKDSANRLYFVISGGFAVKKDSGFEDKKQVMALLDRGAMVGEACLITGSLRTGEVVAIEESEVIYLERAALFKLMDEEPVLAIKLYEYCLKVCSIRLQLCTERIAHIL